MNPAQKALWYIESHLAGPLTLDEIAAIGGVSRFHMVRAFAIGDGVFGHALCACPPAQQGGARAGRRRARHSQSRAGCGLRLSRSLHPRVPRPFRRHARSGPRRNVPRSSQASGANRHGLNPARQSQGPAFRDRQAVARRRHRRTLHLRRRRRHSRPVAALSPVSRRHSRARSARWPMASAAMATIPAISITSPASRCPTSPTCRANSPACGFRKQKYAVFTHAEHISTIRRTVNTIWNHWLPASGMKAADAPQLRALRRKVRSAHRQWRAGDLDTGEGIASAAMLPCAPQSPAVAWQAISTLP